MESLSQAAKRPFGKRLCKAFADVAAHPSFVTSVGNVIYAAAQPHGSRLQQIAQTAATVITLGAVAFTAFRASWRGEDLSDPYFIMGASNILTAGVLMYNGVSGHHVTRHMWLANTALAGWGVGHLFSGVKEKTGRDPRSLAVTNMTWYGAADVTVAFATPPSPLQAIPVAIAGAGLLKTFLGGKFLKNKFENAAKPPPAEGSPRWHVTPSRIYGIGYVVNGILAYAADPVFAAVNMIWAAGYWCFDKKENKALRHSIAGAVKRVF